jgi:hypothetical protein
MYKNNDRNERCHVTFYFTRTLQLRKCESPVSHLKRRKATRNAVGCTWWVYEVTFIVNENVMQTGTREGFAQTSAMLF